MKKQIGYTEVKTGDIEPVYSSENGFNKNADWLKDWALLLNSPWSNNTVSYLIKPINEGFVCKYTVISYDSMSASIMGYGKTPEEALKNCMMEFDKIQKDFNPEDDCF